MKKVILAIVLSLALTVPSFAGGHHSTTINNITNVTEVNQDKIIYAAELDAPDLIVINDTWSAGLEGGKDLFNTNVDEGWYVVGKITCKWTAWDLRKKK